MNEGGVCDHHQATADQLMRGHVRITAGQWRGRKVICPDEYVRPTTSWARETLFSWLRSCVGKQVLDCAAGSGILGFEALSRGAEHALFCDIQPKVLQCIRQSIDVLAAQAECKAVDITACQPDMLPKSSIDILFYDPPYDAPWAETALQALLSYGWLRESGCLFYESKNQGPKSIGPWEIIRQKKRGGVCLNLYQHISATD